MIPMEAFVAMATTKKKEKKEVVVKQPVPCWCGCGGTTRSRFVPGHDARFHGWAKNTARGIFSLITPLPHDEARAEFERLVKHEEPKVAAWKAKEAEKAAKKVAREAVKAALAAATVAVAAVEKVTNDIEQVSEIDDDELTMAEVDEMLAL